MYKKIFALMLSFVLVFGTATSAAYFSDLQDGSYNWAKDTINDLANKGIIKGYDDGTYGPAREITRQEALTLLARAVGVNDYYNSYIVEFNQYEYKDIADNYNTYAKKELCFMIERDILSEDDMDFYLSESEKNKVMLRHEAAVLISKLLDIRGGFDENASYDSSFTDKDKIPAESLNAVNFVASEGILTGMEDGSFSPDTGVTRAQVAIILDRIIKKLNIDYITGTVTNVYEGERALEIDGVKKEFDNKVLYRVNGEKREFSDSQIGDTVTVISTSSGVWVVEAMRPAELKFETVVSKITNVTSTTITVADGSVYGISAFLTCTEEGESIAFKDMDLKNPVELGIVNGFVRTIAGMGDQVVYENAKVISISVLPDRMLKFTDEYGAENEFEIAEDAKILRNGYEIDLKELENGEIVSVSAEDGIISKIGAYEDFGGAGAKVRQLVIGEDEINMLVGNGDGVRIKVRPETVFYDEAGNLTSIYGMRVGGGAILTFKAGELFEVRVGKYIPPVHFTGTVEKVYADEGLIKVVSEGEDRIVHINEKTSILDYATKSKIKLDEIEKGDVLIIDGVYEDDEFVAVSIVL